MLIDPFWYSGGITDPNFANVVLLLHLDGTNGSTTFPDSSSHNHFVGPGGPDALTTATPKFGTASLLSSTSGFINSADSPDWLFGSGQFTVEAWVYPTSAISGVRGIASQFGGASNLGWFFGFNGNTLNFFYSTTGSDNPVISGAYTPTLNSWVHVAADRDASNVLRVYANGAVIALATVAVTFFDSTQGFVIGNDNNLTRGFAGQIDELRITKGVARYGGAFTPPSAPFPDA